jgi:YggT family protein
MNFPQQTVNILLDILSVLIVIRVLMSWFVQHPERHALARFIMDTTDPIIKPIRRALPRMGMLDLSPLVVLILIELIRSLLNSIL